MTRLVLTIVLAFIASVGCKKDSSTHSHGGHGGEEHSHEGDEAHAHEEDNKAIPPTKEVPVFDAGAAGKAAKAAPSGDASAKDEAPLP